MYNEFITQLLIHAEAVRVLAKGYIPILLVTPLKLKENFRCSENYNKKNESRL